MPESIVLTTPEPTISPTTRWVVKSLLVERGLSANGATITNDPAKSRIKVVLIGEHGHRKSYEWVGASADADIVALNKVNLTSNSLNARIINKLIAAGVVAGTASGSVD